MLANGGGGFGAGFLEERGIVANPVLMTDSSLSGVDWRDVSKGSSTVFDLPASGGGGGALLRGGGRLGGTLLPEDSPPAVGLPDTSTALSRDGFPPGFVEFGEGRGGTLEVVGADLDPLVAVALFCLTGSGTISYACDINLGGVFMSISQ